MRKFDLDFLIDGQPILAPDADVEISMEDMEAEESGRDESGVLHRVLLREKVRSWGLSYGTLTREEYCYMDALFRGKSAFTVQERSPDGSVAEYVAFCPQLGFSLHNQKTGIYKNLKFNITEC